MKKQQRLLVTLLAVICVLAMLVACSPERYTVTFVNEDGTVLQSGELEAGAMPQYAGETPTKASDDNYEYTFKGWDVELSAVSADVTYTATYTSSAKQYTVTFKNGETVLQSSKVDYGTIPTYTGTPTKAETAQYTYVFAGWDNQIVAVTGDATYNATFTEVVKKYTVKFVNHDGAVLQQDKIAYGAMPAYTGDVATKDATAQYNYTFKGWDNEIVAVTGDATYTATFDSALRSYAIKFVNHDGTELQNTLVEYGAMPAYTGATATKDATAQYSYTFKGWDNEIVAVTGDATYTATFDSALRSYAIKFVNHDGTELQNTLVEYGAMPAYTGATATKTATAQYSYTFKGWDSEIVAVTGEATYTATFDSAVNRYTVKFVNWDDSAIDGIVDQTADYGTEIAIPTIVPTKPNDGGHGYVFESWTPALAEGDTITGDVTYKATFTETELQYNYFFYDEDGETILKNGTSSISVAVVAPIQNPTKTATAQYTYAFDGWYTQVEGGGDKVTTFGSISAETKYYARYTATVNQYTIKFVDEQGNPIDGIANQTADYGTEIAIPANQTKADDAVGSYVFDGWFDGENKLTEDATIVGDVTYKAVFSIDAYVNYVIIFQNGEEEFSKKADAHYGDEIVAPQTQPTKEPTAQNTYAFDGWYTLADGGDKVEDFGTVSANVTYYAHFTSQVRTYTIKFVNANNELIKEDSLQYGVLPTAPEQNPTLADAGLSVYTFSGWDSEIVAVTCDATYTATYSEQKWVVLNSNPLSYWRNATSAPVSATTEEVESYGYTTNFKYIPLEWDDQCRLLNLVEGADKIKFYVQLTDEMEFYLCVNGTPVWLIRSVRDEVLLVKNNLGTYDIYISGGKLDRDPISSLSEINFNVNGNGNTTKGIYMSEILYFGEASKVYAVTQSNAPIYNNTQRETLMVGDAEQADQDRYGFTKTFTYTSTEWTNKGLYNMDLAPYQQVVFYAKSLGANLVYTYVDGNPIISGEYRILATQWNQIKLVRNAEGTYDVYFRGDKTAFAISNLNQIAFCSNANDILSLTNMIVIAEKGAPVFNESVVEVNQFIATSGDYSLSVAPATTDEQALGITTTYTFDMNEWRKMPLFKFDFADASVIKFKINIVSGTCYFGYMPEGGEWKQLIPPGGMTGGQWKEFVLVRNASGKYDLFANDNGQCAGVQYNTEGYPALTNIEGLKDLAINCGPDAVVKLSNIVVVGANEYSIFSINSTEVMTNNVWQEVADLNGAPADVKDAVHVNDSATCNFADYDLDGVIALKLYVCRKAGEVNFGAWPFADENWHEVLLIRNGDTFNLHIDGADLPAYLSATIGGGVKLTNAQQLYVYVNGAGASGYVSNVTVFK